MKESVISNLIWRFLERICAQGITFVVQIVLARLLLPEYYGTIALISIFTTILQVFVDSGLGNALIQKKNADDKDFSTVFFFNVGMCTVLYFLLFLASPAIARFYENLELTSIIRVAGLTLVISGVKNIQQAYVSKHMLFKKFFWATLIGTIISAIVGITMAYMGAGVWALISQQLVNASIDTILLWITVEWRPKIYFSWSRFKVLFSFGWKLLVSALLDTGYNELRQLIIGKKYSKTDLAYYNQGEKIPKLIIANVNTSIGSVLFPALSSEQSDHMRVKSHMRRAIRTSAYIMWPMMLGVAACAEPLVKVLLTDKWLPAVPYLRIACYVYGLWPIHTTNLQAISAMGRSDLHLKLEIIKKSMGLAVLLLSVKYGVLAIAASAILTDTFCVFINAWPNRRLLGYTYREQLSDLLPAAFLGCGMAGMVYLVQYLSFSPLVTLCIQVPLGILVYILGSWAFEMDSFHYILNSLKHLRENINS